MLLTVSLAGSSAAADTPLSLGEWARFSCWLEGKGRRPSDLLRGDARGLLSGWADKTVFQSRLESLLDRTTSLDLALDRWCRAGIWAITRFDPEYQERLTGQLHSKSPPVLFGVGNRKILHDRGLAVVGSRDAVEADMQFARGLGGIAARQGFSVISGGARGIDESAMMGALRHEGAGLAFRQMT